MRIIYRILLFIVRLTFGTVYPTRQVGREKIPQGSAVICANHSGYADPLLMLLGMDLPSMPCFMAKAELLRVPVLGAFLKAFNVFGVARGKSDRGAMSHADEKLRQGDKVIIYPQGTRVHPGQFVRAKSGAVRLAVENNVPVLPVYVPEKKRVFRRNLIVIGEPYYVRCSDGDPAELRRAAAEIMDKIFALGESTGQKRLSAASEGEVSGE